MARPYKLVKKTYPSRGEFRSLLVHLVHVLRSHPMDFLNGKLHDAPYDLLMGTIMSLLSVPDDNTDEFTYMEMLEANGDPNSGMYCHDGWYDTILGSDGWTDEEVVDDIIDQSILDGHLCFEGE